MLFSGTPLQYACLKNPMDGGAWWAAVHGVAKSWTRLSDFTFTFHFHALEKEMATHSSVLAWRIPGTGEPRGLPSMGSHRVRHDWSDLAAAAACERDQLSLEPAHSPNSISHFKKLYSPLILPCVWKFFSNPHTDHDLKPYSSTRFIFSPFASLQ